jgi:predicted CXXCH cytochrome family protein
MRRLRRYLVGLVLSINVVGGICVLCASRSAYSASEQGFLLVADVDRRYDKTCISAGCHPVEATGSILDHPPYLEGACLNCHLDHSSTVGNLLRRPMNDVCLKCHTSVELDPKTHQLTHPPNTRNCTDCHNPHQSRVRNLLRSDAQLGICVKCHENVLEAAKKMPYRHKYFDPVNECGYCHYAHRLRAQNYLRDNVTESCLTCHDLPIQEDGRRIEDVGKVLREAKEIHGGKQILPCPTCHTPHGSDQPSLLRPGYPAGAYEVYNSDKYALCWQCHDAALVESVQGKGATDFRDKDVNLHRIHVVELRRGRACHICHEPHASDRPHLLRTRLIFQKWNAPFGYDQLPDGGRCDTPCHRPKEYQR